MSRKGESRCVQDEVLPSTLGGGAKQHHRRGTHTSDLYQRHANTTTGKTHHKGITTVVVAFVDMAILSRG